MKKLLFLTLLMVTSMAVNAQNIVTVCVADESGTPTNIRNAPNGKVVYQLDESLSCTVDIMSVKNGWWKITPEVETWGDDEKTIPLKGSTTGYWIHHSVLGLGIAGDPVGCLRTAPSKGAKALKIAQSDLAELYFEPVLIKGSWLKVISKNKKYTGWMPIDRICSNPLTTCP